ncbi:MAG: outer membrane lipoprotein-sorting protein [Nitrospirae bacterium]|nr:outer membrane lipoprotein-sorting protein [Nitrospirota bacterium]
MSHFTKTFSRIFLILMAVVLLPAPLLAMEPAEIIKKSQAAFYEAGQDFQARVKMTLTTREGQQRLREFTMLRKNDMAGEQKYFIYFHSPGDVAGTTFMVYKYPNRDSDRWLFIPAINLVNRIAARDSRSSFVGSDFTYEDVSGRPLEADTHKLIKEEAVNGRLAYVVESVPKSAAEYTRKLAWIDQVTFLPLKEEYYDIQGVLYKVFTAGEVKEIQSLSTIMKRTMENVKSGHKTDVVFERVQYNVGIGDDLFSERYLRRPPEKWIK